LCLPSLPNRTRLRYAAPASPPHAPRNFLAAFSARSGSFPLQLPGISRELPRILQFREFRNSQEIRMNAQGVGGGGIGWCICASAPTALTPTAPGCGRSCHAPRDSAALLLPLQRAPAATAAKNMSQGPRRCRRDH